MPNEAHLHRQAQIGILGHQRTTAVLFGAAAVLQVDPLRAIIDPHIHLTHERQAIVSPS